MTHARPEHQTSRPLTTPSPVTSLGNVSSSSSIENVSTTYNTYNTCPSTYRDHQITKTVFSSPRSFTLPPNNIPILNQLNQIVLKLHFESPNVKVRQLILKFIPSRTWNKSTRVYQMKLIKQDTYLITIGAKKKRNVN